jgi:hypothetical protein
MIALFPHINRGTFVEESVETLDEVLVAETLHHLHIFLTESPVRDEQRVPLTERYQ